MVEGNNFMSYTWYLDPGEVWVWDSLLYGYVGGSTFSNGHVACGIPHPFLFFEIPKLLANKHEFTYSSLISKHSNTCATMVQIDLQDLNHCGPADILLPFCLC